MPNILKLAPFLLARCRLLVGLLALQCLDASQFIGAVNHFSMRSQGRRHAIQLAQVGHFGVALFIFGSVQPASDAVRLEIPLLTKRAAWRGEIRSTILRRSASTAISRPLHSVIGRPEAAGASQPMRTIWQTCSSLIWIGRPGRGTSVKRSTRSR